MPLPGSQVIGPRWADHHRPVVAATFTATCSIRHPGGTPGVFNPVSGTRPITPHPVFHTGPCRVQVLGSISGQVSTPVTAEQEISTINYRVSVDWDAVTSGADDIFVDDLVTFSAVGRNGDPTLVGRTLTVRGITRGSLVWSRALTCTDSLG